MLDISHLVVLGCSFSYGQGLTNPKEESWPALLSKKLNVPVVNLSSRGGGNDRIMRRLAEYHYLDSANNNNPFYIIAYSHSSRREEYLRETNDYSVIGMNQVDLLKQQPFSEPCILNYDPVVCARKKLITRSYILDFLKLNNINYLVADFAPDKPDELQIIRELYPKVYDRIYADKYKLKNLNEISMKYPRLPCGHDDIEAQIEIGNYVYDELLLRYSNPTVNLQDYTTLTQYREHYDIVGSRGDLEWL